MSGAMSAEVWERVFADEASKPGRGFHASNCVVDRMVVPSGWLYRTYSVFYRGYGNYGHDEKSPPEILKGSVAIAFVPFADTLHS